MNLTEFASSQAPNLLGAGFTVLLAAVALGMRDRLRWLYAVLVVMFAAVVVLKNFSYKGLVAGAEGSLDAHGSYAGALFWVIVAQVAIGVILLLAATFSGRVRWLAVTAALACGYAAICMTGWRQAYLAPNADVQYEVWAPPLHWVILAGLVIAVIMAVVSLIRGRRATTTP
jgi:hypothetical protein